MGVTAEARLLIDGELVDARSGARFDNLNPATEEVLGDTCDAGAADADAAVAAARRAFDETTWSTDAELRSRCLLQLQAAMGDELEHLREVLVAEAGSPVFLTRLVQLDPPIDDLAYWAALATGYDYRSTLPEVASFGTTSRREVWREATGVVAAITPWNFPVLLNLAKLGPALAAGCTVVLKPPPDTPWSATEIGRLVAERTDIPPGVVNVVPSSDHGIGEQLTLDPRVDMVTFTGSTATGRRVMANAAATVKKVFLELGGKSAHIVLDDADIAAVVPMVAMGVCTHAGQGCAITTRLLLPRARYEEGVEAARAGLASVPVGDPTDPSVMTGPLINARQRERVLGYIEKGKAEGARLVTGGGRPADLDRGYFVEPTLFADVDPASTIAQEEIFGPVLVAIPYDDDDDAARIANATIYGLSGAISSGDEARAVALARRIRTGTLGINGAQWLAPDSPFGGYRQSGVGRENGVAGFEEYLEIKTVALPAR